MHAPCTPHTNVHTHIHHIHTQNILTHTHAYTHPCTYPYTHACTNMCTPTFIHTHVHVLSRIRICLSACTCQNNSNSYVFNTSRTQGQQKQICIRILHIPQMPITFFSAAHTFTQTHKQNHTHSLTHEHTRTQVSKEEAERRIKEINEPYKLEILESILARTPDANITIYHIGEKDHPMHWCVFVGHHIAGNGSQRAFLFVLELESKALFQRGAPYECVYVCLC